ncbi:MAG TPA: ribonuclease J [Alphaproteobacteria bacterium]|nr:ribonuclease J [Alphaproteobacteria bacterium]
MPPDSLLRADDDAIDVIPMGGAGGFGMNVTLYGHGGKWIMVDLGMGFADDRVPGVELLVPDVSFIAQRRHDLLGIVLTHAHEDHLGAVPYLWPRLRCPIYATPFTAAVLRLKLIEHQLRNEIEIREIPQSGAFEIGPFALSYIDVTHSIPEPNMLRISTSAGTVVHTGDWKLDPGPVVGRLTDIGTLEHVGDQGVLAVIGDSTNALTPGHSGSEAALLQSLTELFPTYKQRIVVACFSSNVARIESIARAAAAVDRSVAIIGRSLWKIVEAARETGYLKGLPDFADGKEAAFLPREKTVLICTGSQGELRAALSRIAAGDHPDIDLESGDTVIFSSRPIPGNEQAIGFVQSRLMRRGINVVTARDAFVHVSGHPAHDELVQMYEWLRPRSLVAVHGEYPHQAEHARIARNCQIGHTIVPENGEVVRLRNGHEPKVVSNVTTGILAVDGKRLLPLDSGVIRGRRRAIEQGQAVVTVVIDRKGRLMAPPKVSARGLLSADQDQPGLAEAAVRVEAAIDALPGLRLRDDAELHETIRLACRKALNDLTGKKPDVDVHLMRID